MWKIDYTLRLYRNHENKISELYHKKSHKGDAGVDLYCPREIVVPAKSQAKIRLGCHASINKKTRIRFPTKEDITTMEGIGYFLFPRSSISKTPLRMSNSIGLIDAGYRGELIGVVDNISEEDYTVRQGDRLFQIVNPDLIPFTEILENEESDMDETERGSGGFGSTGK
jgi:dUTP pyrophosphatase